MKTTRGVVVMMTAIALVGCGSGRSAAAFCSTLESEKSAFVSKYDERAQQLEGADDLGTVLGGLASGIESLGDAGVIFRKLADVAPDEIRADVEVIRDSLDPGRQADQVKDMVGNPLGTLFGGIAGGLMSAGSWQRVDEYIQQNC